MKLFRIYINNSRSALGEIYATNAEEALQRARDESRKRRLEEFTTSAAKWTAEEVKESFPW